MMLSFEMMRFVVAKGKPSQRSYSNTKQQLSALMFCDVGHRRFFYKNLFTITI
jgi:hypothetical protein